MIGAAPTNSSMSAADMLKFCDFFYQLTGIKFTENKRYFVDKRVASCVEASGEVDFRRWFSVIRAGADSKLTQAMINKLTVNETYFAREAYQLKGLVRSAMPAVLAARTDDTPIRILSLPCSTGEEAFSIAIELLEHWPEMATVDVSIVGADIDTHVLAAARQGVYGARALHNVPTAHRARYFTSVGADHWQISDDLRDAIDFVHVNICDPASVRALRMFDIVLCRNLLIYFDQLSARTAAENLFSILRPGGFLFLGHSESMSRTSSIFEPVRFPDGIAYQRPKVGPR